MYIHVSIKSEQVKIGKHILSDNLIINMKLKTNSSQLCYLN